MRKEMLERECGRISRQPVKAGRRIAGTVYPDPPAPLGQPHPACI